VSSYGQAATYRSAALSDDQLPFLERVVLSVAWITVVILLFVWLHSCDAY
jgi:hypothetical protein